MAGKFPFFKGDLFFIGVVVELMCMTNYVFIIDTDRWVEVVATYSYGVSRKS